MTRSWREYLHRSNQLFTSGLAVFIILSMMSFWASYRANSSLLGSEGYRLGYLVLICAITIGLSAKLIINRQGLIWYYAGSIVMLTASICYHYAIFHLAGRLAWPVVLSNNLALLLAAAVIVGIYIANRSNWWIIMMGQIFLLAGIVLTQSRAVFLLTIVLSGAYLLKRYGARLTRKNHRHYLWPLLAAMLATFIFMRFAPPRLKSTNYLKISIIYRLELQKRGLEMISIKPLAGVGSDAVQFYFNQGTNYGAYLSETLKSGYKFMSVHNVYLDKLIEYGLLAGIIFCFLAARAIWRGGMSSSQPISVLIWLVFVLFSLYGLVDFFSMETTVLFWLVLFYLNISNLTADSK